MSANRLLDVAALLAFHDGERAAPSGAPWPDVVENHRRNMSLWAEEDLARRRDAPDAEIVANKRAIDAHNQARNDAIERIDAALLEQLGTLDANARLNSETAGMIVDRLSILALRIRAMRAQAGRHDADAAHRAACAERLARLEAQRSDLAACLDALLADCAAGRARFKVYRQFKMYNDPAYK